MSEIKVNKISPRTNCGTVTLGDSGDTFTIPAGATITNNGTAAGFGATGAASWDTTVKTGDFTAVNGVGYFVNTTSGEIDVTLPAGSAGDVVAVADYANTADTNNIILKQNGSDKIEGSTNNFVVNQEGSSVTLVFVDSTKGWIITDTGNSADVYQSPYIIATGGTITECGNDKIHTFTGPGTFTVTCAACSPSNNEVSYMVIAGGGAGGDAGNRGAGGGGAGGFRETKTPITPYTASPLCGYATPGNRVTVTATSFPITVGAGGAGSASPNTGGSGGVSTFSTITSAGGGGGGGESPIAPEAAGQPGGSGGGAGRGGTTGPVGSGNTPPTTPAQGTNGGTAGGSGDSSASGGGGGGATAVGSNGGPGSGGNGGAGATTSINGTPTARAGGGGGAVGCGTVGSGSSGGGDGGAFPTPAGTAGTANTGGGGGGVSDNGGGNNGGSGIVIIRYKFQ